MSHYKIHCSKVLAINLLILFVSLTCTPQFAIAVSAFQNATEEQNAPGDEKESTPVNEVKVETLVENLNRPLSLAIQPETNRVFVSLRADAVVEIGPKGKTTVAINGFANDKEKALSDLDPFESGPLGLCFFDKDVLAVGLGSTNPQSMIQTFKISDRSKWPRTSSKPDAESLINSSGKFESVCSVQCVGVSGKRILLSLLNKDDLLCIGRIRYDTNKLKLPRLHFKSELKFEKGSRIPFALTPRGEIAVVQNDTENNPENRSATIYMYTTTEGRFLSSFRINGISDVSDIEFLKAKFDVFVSVNQSKTSGGGIYRIVRAEKPDANSTQPPDAESGLKAVKVVDIDRPIAMSFDGKGNLLVLTSGGNADSSGALLRISGLNQVDE